MNLPFANFVKRHYFSRAALSLGVITAAVVFFAAGALLRLFMGPVSLGPLRGPIADAIRQAMPGIILQYDQAAVEWSRDDGRINLVVLGARMFDVNGRIVAQAPLARYRPEEHLPGPGITDDADLLRAAGDLGTTIFHPVGTARMGPDHDAGAVLDARLRVRGVRGLRVADASAMPRITSGNTNSPTIMLAEKGAAMILEDAG